MRAFLVALGLFVLAAPASAGKAGWKEMADDLERFVDQEAGVVCYLYNRRELACVKIGGRP